ncbi:MAG TPA: hypothetical protein VF290_09680 [Pyrinomonadaceae bacterium]
MKLCLLTLFCLLVPCSFAREVQAKEWRGIVPLHSTRADVARLFPACSEVEGRCIFRVGNEQVLIVFSSVRSELHECEKELPHDTVLLVQVELATPVSFGSLKVNKKIFRTFDPSTPPNIGYKGYIDEKEGLLIKTYKGKVLQLSYIATSKEVSRCPSYYEDPESFIGVFIHYYVPAPDIDCPKEAVDGERIVFSTDPVDRKKFKYTWAVTVGKIVAGQGTPKITVDTTGLGGQTIITTLERGQGHHVTATSCKTTVLVKPN